MKYLWTLGYINVVPPHFPVDRMIQEALKYKDLFNWTELDDISKYIDFIAFAKIEMEGRQLSSLGDLELIVYNEWINKLKK